MATTTSVTFSPQASLTLKQLEEQITLAEKQCLEKKSEMPKDYKNNVRGHAGDLRYFAKTLHPQIKEMHASNQCSYNIRNEIEDNTRLLKGHVEQFSSICSSHAQSNFKEKQKHKETADKIEMARLDYPCFARKDKPTDAYCFPPEQSFRTCLQNNPSSMPFYDTPYYDEKMLQPLVEVFAGKEKYPGGVSLGVMLALEDNLKMPPMLQEGAIKKFTTQVKKCAISRPLSEEK